jgi:hypothetical protein
MRATAIFSFEVEKGTGMEKGASCGLQEGVVSSQIRPSLSISLWYETLGGSGMADALTVSVRSCATLIWTNRLSGLGMVAGDNTATHEGVVDVGGVVSEFNDGGGKEEGACDRSSTFEIAASVASVL